MNLAAILIAEAASSNESISESTWSQIISLPDIKFDRDSFAQDQGDVIFRAWLKNVEGKDQEVWARVGMQKTPAQAKDLESKLLQAIADLEGKTVSGHGRRIPPGKPPSNSVPAKDEGPGDGKRKGITISRVDTKTLMVCADKKDKVMKVGRLNS